MDSLVLRSYHQQQIGTLFVFFTQATTDFETAAHHSQSSACHRQRQHKTSCISAIHACTCSIPKQLSASPSTNQGLSKYMTDQMTLLLLEKVSFRQSETLSSLLWKTIVTSVAWTQKNKCASCTFANCASIQIKTENNLFCLVN